MRRYAILGIILAVAFGSVGTVAAMQEWWTVLIIVGFGLLLLIAFALLTSTRYLARLLRTIETKSRGDNRRLREQLAEVYRKCDAALDVQERVLDEQQELFKLFQEKLTSQNDHIVKIDDRIRNSTRTTINRLGSTVQHGTNEIEALLQIFSRYSQLKLPMPHTGGWALDARSLAHLLSIVEEQRPQRILELGSGSSTIWLGYLCRSYGGKLVTLDHLADYLDATRIEVAKHELDEFIECRLAPLEEVMCDGRKYSWYDPRALMDLSDIDLVLVDGPPATTGPKARYPALANIIDLLAPDVTVVLDDAHRPDEVDTVDQWLTQFPDFSRVPVGTPRLAVLKRKG